MMRGTKKMIRIQELVTCCFVLALLALSCGVSWAEEESALTGIAIKKNIRVVYQIKTDDWKEGIGSGLHYVRKLVNAYDKMEVEQKDRAVHAVFHGDAGYWMLKDKSYSEFKNTQEGNPNKHIIKELVDRGVSIEICAQTMKSHDWKADDIHSDVQIVIGAYPRIIDLQLQGFAYIRF